MGAVKSHNRRSAGYGERGTTAIEFAIVAPVLILLLGSMAEVGAFILIQTQLQFATESAARQIRIGTVGPTTTGGTPQMTVSGLKTLICKQFLVPSCTSRIKLDVQRADSFANLKTMLPKPLENVGPQTPSASYTETYLPGSPGQMGSLVITYDWKFVFPSVGAIFGNLSKVPGVRRLSGLAVYRNEM